MTLVTETGTTSLRRVRLRRAERTAFSLDATLMTASFVVCAGFFGSGGLEAITFAIACAVLGARNAGRGRRAQAAYAGGFAGLFVGAVFAAFFHGALVAAVQTMS